jgi:hypothetical protein
MRIVGIYSCEGDEVAIVEDVSGARQLAYRPTECFPFWVSVRGFAHHEEKGRLVGRWVWKNGPLDADNPVEAFLNGVSLPRSASRDVTSDALNACVLRGMQCLHSSGRHLLYEPLETDENARRQQATALYNVPLHRRGTAHTRRSLSAVRDPAKPRTYREL